MKALKRQFKILKSIKPDEIKKEEFAKLLAKMSADHRPPSFSWRRLPIFLKSAPALAFFLILFLIGSGAGITFASQDALPGDALYPAKLAVEKIMVAVAGNVEKKTELRLEYAGRRLDEVEKIVEQKNEMEEKEVATVLEDYEKKLDDAQKAARIEKPDAPKAVSAVQESAKVYERNIAELISRAEEKKMGEKVKERLERAREHTKEKFKDDDERDENEYEKEDKKENEKESGEIRKENKKEGAKIKQSGKNQNNVTVSNQTIVGLETLSLL